MKLSYPNRIRARIQEIEATLASLAKLEAELSELRIAEKVIARLGPDEDTAASAPVRLIEGQKSSSLTTKEAVLIVLEQAAEIWLTTQQVRERASEFQGRDIPLGTIAPNLSDLKNEGRIQRDGARVAHVERLQAKRASALAEAQINPSTTEDQTDAVQTSEKGESRAP